jgi:hypothetical protein
MKYIHKSLKNIAILIVPALILFFGALSANAQTKQKICGSVEKFNETGRWQDLPGCTDEFDTSDQTSAGSLMSRAKNSCREFFETWEKGDLDHIKSTGGDCTGLIIYAKEYWDSDPQLVRAKPAYQRIKATVDKYFEWLPFVESLVQRYFYAMTYLEEARKKGDIGTADISSDFVKDLKNSLKEAEEKQVPDNTIIPGIGAIPSATIAEIKSKLNSYFKQANETKIEAVEADRLKWEPYTKLLSGDRLKFFNETHRSGTKVFGRGGTILWEPGDFDKAAVMCTRTWGRNGIFETWRVDCWSFSGDRQTSGPRSRSGYGTNTPASAFQ